MSRGLNCPHCKRWVDKDMCHVSQICPYCGARMTEISGQRLTYVENPSDSDEEEGDGLSITGAIITGIAEAVLLDDDSDDQYTNDLDPSFVSSQGDDFFGGGGSFGGGGADDSW